MIKYKNMKYEKYDKNKGYVQYWDVFNIGM